MDKNSLIFATDIHVLCFRQNTLRIITHYSDFSGKMYVSQQYRAEKNNSLRIGK